MKAKIARTYLSTLTSLTGLWMFLLIMLVAGIWAVFVFACLCSAAGLAIIYLSGHRLPEGAVTDGQH